MWRRNKSSLQFDKRRRINKFRSMNKAVLKKKALKTDGATLEVCSWNVEEKGSPAEIDSLVFGTAQDKPEVVCLQRANLPPPDTETDNYKWHCGSGTSGSAILIKKSSDLVLNSFEQFSDRICMAGFTGKQGVRINVISCFIPPVTDYACADSWSKLKEVMGSIPPTAIFILAGDFNAQVGKDNAHFSTLSASDLTIKRLYHKTTNENGKNLTDLIRKCHLRLFISQKKNSPDTCTFNDGKTKTQESFIILPYPRPSFSGEGYNYWHKQYSHAMIRFKLLYKPFDPVPVEKNEDGSVEVRPPIIASWNIQNATPAKIDYVLNDYDLPVVCIQELFLTSDEDIQTENYNWLSPKKLWAKNVGILVKKSQNISVSSFEPLSEFLCAATIVYNEKPLIVISSYLPPESDPQHCSVLTQMRELIKGIPEDVLVILGGDFSSVIKAEHVPNADLFLKDLASEIKMELAGGSTMYRRFCHLTQISEEGKCRAHYVLVSQSSLKTMFYKLWCRWTPFFENLLVSIVAVTDKKPKMFTFDKLKTIDNPVIESSMDKNEDGVRKKTLIFKFPSESGNDLRDDITSLVSPDDVEKFKDTPAPAEDLGRLLVDLVLLKVANRKSFVNSTPFNTLVKSLSECKLGPLTVEEVQEANKSKVCRLKWQDILLAEEVGTSEDLSINIRNKAAQAVFAKICQTCYTVKAKNSYYNKGKQPLLMGSPELAEVIKVVKKESVPTLEDVYKHIDEFITKDSDEELVFGSGFPKQELLDIAGYAYGKNGLLDIRFFMSKNRVLPPPDNLAVFIKRTPQYLRDMLIKKPKNFRYYLVHPCGLGGDYEEFDKRFSADILKEEIDLFNKKNAAQQKNTQQDAKQHPKQPQHPSRVAKQVQQPRGGEKPVGSNPRASQNTRPQGSGSRKRDFNASNSSQNGFKRSGPSGGASAASKRQKLNTPVDNRAFKIEMPYWPNIRPLVIVWPITVRSQLEERPEHVLSENFTIEFQAKDVNGQNVTAVSVALTQYNGNGRMYCIARGNSARNAARVALDLLIKHCTVIKPNSNYLCNGRVPNFIRYKVPCQFNPRTYLILDRHETGQLSWKVIEDLVERFLNSYEEEMFFDRDTYSFTEKLALVESVPKLAPSKLMVRHFGDDIKLVDRYVCVYKVRPKQDILREVLKMRGQHPKYTMTTNRLPPGIEYNIF